MITQEIKVIPFNELVIDHESNPREDYGKAKTELAASILENGLVTPLVINHDNKVIAGHRRCQAIETLIAKGQINGTFDVPVIYTESDITKEDVEMLHIITNDGKELTILEQGYVYANLVAEGVARKDIAAKTGKSQMAIGNAIRLTESPEAIQNYINDGTISASRVLDLFIESDKDWEKTLVAVEEDIKAAKEAGKKKATKKHSKEKEAKEAKEYYEVEASEYERLQLLSKGHAKLIKLYEQVEALQKKNEDRMYMFANILEILGGSEETDISEVRAALKQFDAVEEASV